MLYVIGLIGFLCAWFLVTCGLTAVGDWMDEKLG